MDRKINPLAAYHTRERIVSLDGPRSLPHRRVGSRRAVMLMVVVMATNLMTCNSPSIRRRRRRPTFSPALGSTLLSIQSRGRVWRLRFPSSTDDLVSTHDRSTLDATLGLGLFAMWERGCMVVTQLLRPEALSLHPRSPFRRRRRRRTRQLRSSSAAKSSSSRLPTPFSPYHHPLLTTSTYSQWHRTARLSSPRVTSSSPRECGPASSENHVALFPRCHCPCTDLPPPSSVPTLRSHAASQSERVTPTRSVTRSRTPSSTPASPRTPTPRSPARLPPRLV